LVSPAAFWRRRKNLDRSRNLVLKKTRDVLSRRALKKGVVPAVRRMNPVAHDDRTPEAKPTLPPDPEWIEDL